MFLIQNIKGNYQVIQKDNKVVTMINYSTGEEFTEVENLVDLLKLDYKYAKNTKIDSAYIVCKWSTGRTWKSIKFCVDKAILARKKGKK